QISGDEIPIKEEKKRISEDKLKISMILSDETMDKLQRLKSLLGKSMSMEELINFMVDQTISNVEKKKFKTSSKDSLPPVEGTGRYVSNPIKKEVYERDQKRCAICG